MKYYKKLSSHILVSLASITSLICFPNISYGGVYILPQNLESEVMVLQNYIKQYQKNTQSSLSRHNILGPDEIGQEISSMIFELDDILAGNYAPFESKKRMEEIVSRVKVLNSKIKILIKNEQEKKILELESTKQRYIKSLDIIEGVLYRVLDLYSQRILNQNSYNAKQKKQIAALKEIRLDINYLKSFEDINFRDEKEMKSYIQKAITNIRKQIEILRSVES